MQTSEKSQSKEGFFASTPIHRAGLARASRRGNGRVFGDSNSRSEVDLLAALLAIGFQPDSEAKERSRTILRAVGGLSGLRSTCREDLAERFALREHEAEVIAIAVEIGWRLIEAPWTPGEVFRSSDQVWRQFRPILSRETVEVVWALFLDSRLRQLGAVEIARGSLTGALVSSREVLKLALRHNAAAFLLMHNHPSGDPEPSAADHRLTGELKEAARLMQIDFLDHLVFGADRYCSFADRRLM